MEFFLRNTFHPISRAPPIIYCGGKSFFNSRSNEKALKMKPKIENNIPTKVNLLDVAASESMESLLEAVRLSNDETAIIPFTSEGQEVALHYCPETEINSYVICNGDSCVLCKIGRKLERRYLLPVYLPAKGIVGILPVSPSLRPFALLPQIKNVLKAEKPMVMFVKREVAKFTVSTGELPDDVDGGEAEIKRFQEDQEAGIEDFSSVFPRIDNEQLSGIEEISKMLKLKGI